MNRLRKMRSLSSIADFHNNTRFAVSVNEGQEKLPTFCWLPKLHKQPYKARFIAYSSSFTTTGLSKLLTATKAPPWYFVVVGIPMGINCAPFVADLFCSVMRETSRDFMLSLSEDNQSDVIEAFNSTSRYLNDLLNIDSNVFDSMVNHIYPSGLQLNKANVSDTEASFLDLNLSISDGFVKTKIYDKRDDFDFDIVNFTF